MKGIKKKKIKDQNVYCNAGEIPKWSLLGDPTSSFVKFLGEIVDMLHVNICFWFSNLTCKYIIIWYSWIIIFNKFWEPVFKKKFVKKKKDLINENLGRRKLRFDKVRRQFVQLFLKSRVGLTLTEEMKKGTRLHN